MRNRVSKIPVLLIVSRDVDLRRRLGRAVWANFSVEQRGGRTGLDLALRELKPAVLLLDLEVRRLGGIRNLPSIQRPSPLTKIILLTSAPRLREEINALKLGAKGYCGKSISNELIRKAVRVVQSGEVWSGRKIIRNLLEEVMAQKRGNRARFLPSPEAPLDRLTSRKREIAELVDEGASNRYIAQTLRITEATVKAHLTGILRKLQISNRLNLAVLIASQKPRLGALGLSAAVTFLAQEI